MRVGVGLRGALLWLQGSNICIASESIQPARPASSCGRLCTAYGQLRLASFFFLSFFFLLFSLFVKLLMFLRVCVCVIFLMWEKRINNRASDLAAWLRLCAPQTARKIQNSPKPAFSHGVQLGCVKAHSTTNAMFDCQTILSLHTHTHAYTQGILSLISPRPDDITHPCFSTFSHTITNQQRTLFPLSRSVSLSWNGKRYNYSNHLNTSCASAHAPWTSVHSPSRVASPCGR